ncbi:hypothetical protein [Sulfurimonas sp.]|uniref:hypothetical protein n=1 Tax=Sulfurimonas sp. TaxID=2022749 RepID=UPI003D0C0A5A
MDDNKYLRLPNADSTLINAPDGSDTTIEVGLFKDHRFAFYFWFKWWKQTTRKLNDDTQKAPSLISIDWHRDLCAPCDSEKTDLESLNLNSYKEVALFSWDKLNPLNDGHILSAVYLNLIGDVYVLCKQDEDLEEENFIDRWGYVHKVKCFSTKEELLAEVKKDQVEDIYFDIDLDYFTESDEACGAGENMNLRDDEVVYILDIESDFMDWIFQNMRGMTIATEPEFCGGIKNSNKIYDLLDSTLFYSQLFSYEAKWKHLQ